MQLKCLTWLELGDCSLITDQGIMAVAGLTDLIHLSIDRTSVTNAGLRHLSSLKNLTYIDFSFCDTSEAAVEELRQQIPGLRIRHDREDEESDEDLEGELSD